MEGECSVRPLAAGDVAAVLDIAARSPEAAQWSRTDYERACRGEFDGWVTAIEENGEENVVGFLITRRMADEMEILNLAVEAALRRRSVASRLLEAALAFARVSGAKTAFLEVRSSNAGAIAFYKGHGFAPAGHRPRYYSDPPEDALVLSRKLA
jgi:ribosomal-protein-alanine N-acetyltransferase